MAPDVDERFAELEASLDAMATRYSALEWFVEQLLANLLVPIPPEDAERSLRALEARTKPAYRRTEEGDTQSVRPDRAAALRREISMIADKVRVRLAQHHAAAHQ